MLAKAPFLEQVVDVVGKEGASCAVAQSDVFLATKRMNPARANAVRCHLEKAGPGRSMPKTKDV